MPADCVLLIRHGQTQWNADGRWQGQMDTPLNEVGRDQAAALAQHLRHEDLRRVVSSDLLRAHDTALALAAPHGLPLLTDPRLREMHMGVLQGLTRAEMEVTHAALLHAWHADFMNHVLDGGESRAQVQARAYAALLDAMTAVDGGVVALVTHGGTIRLVLRKLFPGEAAIGDGAFPNTSITVVRRNADGTWHVDVLGATPHLEQATPSAGLNSY